MKEQQKMNMKSIWRKIKNNPKNIIGIIIVKRVIEFL